MSRRSWVQSPVWSLFCTLTAVWGAALTTFWGCCRLGELTVLNLSSIDPTFNVTCSPGPILCTLTDGTRSVDVHVPWTKTTKECGAMWSSRHTLTTFAHMLPFSIIFWWTITFHLTNHYSPTNYHMIATAHWPSKTFCLSWTRSGLMLASCTSMAIASALVELLSFFLQVCLQRLWLLLGDGHPLHSSCIGVASGNFYPWAPYEPINRMKWTDSPKSSMIFVFMQRFLNLS